MTPEALAEALVRRHLDKGVDDLAAHESDEAEGMEYVDIDLAIDIADEHLRWLSTKVNL